MMKFQKKNKRQRKNEDQNDAILALDTDNSATVVDGLGRVLDLENSAIRGERSDWEIVASADAAHGFPLWF